MPNHWRSAPGGSKGCAVLPVGVVALLKSADPDAHKKGRNDPNLCDSREQEEYIPVAKRRQIEENRIRQLIKVCCHGMSGHPV